MAQAIAERAAMSDQAKPDSSPTEKPRRGAKAEAKAATVAIHLEHGRGRHLTWMLVGLFAGAALLFLFGAVGKVIGLLLVIMALSSGVSAARTLRHQPGTIRVAADHAELPEGLCRGRTEKVSLSEVRHAYTLRRALPFGRTGPLLVIETERGNFAYSRDWFASESDQRRVELALNRRI
jgi:hypothetical protein